MKQKLIELWKNDCEHCEATKPILDKLEKAGYKIERYNVDEEKGRKVWNKYIDFKTPSKEEILKLFD